MERNEESYRHVTDKQLSDLAAAGGKVGATEVAAKFWAELGINIANEKEAKEVRELFIFMFGFWRTYKDARHRFWIIFISMFSAAIVGSAFAAMWAYLKAKVHP